MYKKIRCCLFLIFALALFFATPCLAAADSLPSLFLTARPLTAEECPEAAGDARIYGLFVRLDPGADAGGTPQKLTYLQLCFQMDACIQPWNPETGDVMEPGQLDSECFQILAGDSSTDTLIIETAAAEAPSDTAVSCYYRSLGDAVSPDKDLFVLYFQIADGASDQEVETAFQWVWNPDVLEALNATDPVNITIQGAEYSYTTYHHSELADGHLSLQNPEALAAAEIRLSRDGKDLGKSDEVLLPVGTDVPRTYRYTAEVLDQYGSPMEAEVTWSGSGAAGLSLSPDGVLTVSPETQPGDAITLTASAGDAEASVTVTAAGLEVNWGSVESVLDAGLVYGETLAHLPVTGTADAAGETLEGTFTYTCPDGPWTVGTYHVNAAFTVEIPGQEGTVTLSKAFSVAVQKKPITIRADDVALAYGQDLPETLTFTVPEGALVNGDTAEVLTVRLDAAVESTTVPGTYAITGTASADNYEVTVTPGQLTVAGDAVVSVTAEDGSPLPRSLTIPAWAIAEADGLADLGLPDTVTVTGASRRSETVPAVWSMDLKALQAAAQTAVSKGQAVVTVTLTSKTYPSWAAAPAEPHGVTVTIPDKAALPGGALTLADTVTTYGQDCALPVPALQASYQSGELQCTYTFDGSAEMPVDAGTYTVTVTAENSRYRGTATAKLIILQKELTAAMVTMDAGPFVYTGLEIRPSCTVSDPDARITAEDYQVSWINNTDAHDGLATEPPRLVVTAAKSGNYTGTVTVPFAIEPASLADKTPELTGSGTVGSLLTAFLSGMPADAYVWQWYRGGQLLPEATGSTYLLTLADAGQSITVRAMAQGPNCTGVTRESAAVPVEEPVLTGVVAVSAVADTAEADGTVLEATVHLPAGAAAAYQWYLDGVPVEGATGRTFQVPQGSEGASVTVSVTAAGSGLTGTLTSAPVVVGQPLLQGAVVLTREGGTVSAVLSGNLSEADCTVVWLRDGAQIPGASGLTYSLTQADSGTDLAVVVLAREGCTGSVLSDPLPIPAAVPDAPAVTAEAGDGEVTIFWTTPDSGGMPITGYRLTVTAGEEIVYQTALPAGISQFTCTGLHNGAWYAFTVVAVNQAGIGPGGTATAMPTGQTGGDTGESGETGETGEPDGKPEGGGSVPPVQEEPEEPEPAPAFSDVDAGSWAAPYILDLRARGIVQGVGDNRFSPTRAMTRAEFVKLLAGVAGVDISAYAGETGFSDVDAGAWYAPYAAWAAESGITGGVSAGAFCPDAPITQAQMAAMLCRLASLVHWDLPDASGSFSDAAAALQELGLLDGLSLDPDGAVTREQACKVVSLLLDLLEDRTAG